MTVPITATTPERSALIPRQRDRRAAFGHLLSALTHALGERHDASLMRGLFEETMRRLLPVRTIQLRDRNIQHLGETRDDWRFQIIVLTKNMYCDLP